MPLSFGITRTESGALELMEDHSEAMLGAIEGVFGDRLKRSKPGRPAADGALASVFPASADEAALLARLAERYSVPLTALGAETAQDKPAKEGRILVRFDLMRGLWLSEEPWAEAEPGALWLELDNDLRVRGRGLTAEMAQPRALGEEYMLFGAYPGERSAAVEDAIKEVASSTGGSLLPPAEAYRAWGRGSFPSRPRIPRPYSRKGRL